MEKHKKVFYQKSAALFISLAALVLLFWGVATYQSVVKFSDSGLDAAVRENLEKPHGYIARTELLQITHLEASGRNISRLDGIEHLRRLVVLDLEDNKVEDLSPLKSLSSLRELNLRNNSIADLSPLAALNELVTLNIHSNTGIESISPIAQLAKLQTLIVRKVPIGNQIRVLQDMPNLQKLDVRNCGVTDISALMKLSVPLGLRDPTLAGQNKATVQLNEIMASNGSIIVDEDGDFEDWIELYNYGSEAVDLSDWGLSDSLNDPFKWTFSKGSIIGANEYLLIWASGKDRPGAHFHTNFSIAGSGVELLLTAPDGTRVDELPPLAIPRDISLGRIDAEGMNWFYSEKPSPGEANTTSTYAGILDPVQFSHSGGFYANEFNLTLTHPDPDAVIIYTLDASVPDINNLEGTSYKYKNEWPYYPDDSFGEMLEQTYRSHVYAGPLQIIDRSREPDKYTRMSSAMFTGNDRFSPSHDIFPETPVRKGTVVRAKAVKPGAISSRQASHSYFVFPEGNPYDIPVISLLIQEDLLFDYDTGIYSPGVDFDAFRENNPDVYDGHWRFGNFFRRGRQWEYPANFEVFEPDIQRAVINQGVGIRVHGKDSRSFPIKSVRLYARRRYDDKKILKHSFFPDKVTFAANSENDSFKRILIRGQGSGGPFINDWIAHKLMQPVYEGMLRGIPVIQFINGEYWGLTALRDRFDQYHLAYHYNLDPNNIIMTYHTQAVRGHELVFGIQSDVDLFHEMESFVLNNDMSVKTNYDHLEEMMDVRSYVDHLIANLYLGNTHYEFGFWRVRAPSGPHFSDGKWRTYTKDFDMLNWGYNWLKLRSSSNKFFTKLLESESFRCYFINRFADHMNTTFIPKRIEDIVKEEFAKFEPYLAEDRHRWTRQYPISTDMNQKIINFGYNHAAKQRQYIRNFFDIVSDVNIILDVSNNSHGYVRINTIDIKSGTPGIDGDPYPWSGIYFSDVPIELKAVPREGYRFSGWIVWDAERTDSKSKNKSLDFTSQIISFNVSNDMSIKAVFEPYKH